MSYYVVEDQGLIEKINDFFSECVTVREATSNFIKEHIPGADHLKFLPGDDLSHFGGLRAVIFKKGNEKPKGWIRYKNSGPKCYRPHSRGKDLSELREKWKALPKIEWSVLNKIVNFNPDDSFKVNMRLYCSHPAVTKKGDAIIIELGNDWNGIYKPPKGLREITYTEYKGFTSKEEKE